MLEDNSSDDESDDEQEEDDDKDEYWICDEEIPRLKQQESLHLIQKLKTVPIDACK